MVFHILISKEDLFNYGNMCKRGPYSFYPGPAASSPKQGKPILP